MDSGHEYLVSYGWVGDFGRFHSARPVACRRGDRALVRTHRGVEVGEVLRPAAPGHARFLPNTTVGELLRPLSADDSRTEESLRARGREFLGRAGRLAAELALPVEVLDVEMLFDGEHAVVHCLRGAECDVRPFVAMLSREFSVHVLLTDLTRAGWAAPQAEEDEGEHGCGRCDSGGGCGSCGTGGGCGSSCGGEPDESRARLASLRARMEQRPRKPLL